MPRARLVILLFASLVSCAAAPALSQDHSDYDPQAIAARIAPFLDDQTIAFCRLDTARVDVMAAAKLLADLVAEDAAEIRRQLETDAAVIDTLRRQLREAGGRELLAFLSLRSMPPEPVIVFPVETGGDAEKLAEFVRGMPPLAQALRNEAVHYACEALNESAVFFGPQSALARLKVTAGGDVSEQLVAALTAAGDGAVQQIILPTKDQRRVIAEAMPSLPPELGGGSTEPFTQGLEWIAVGIQSPPDLALRLTVQARDEETAAEQQAVIEKALEWVVGRPEVKEHVPALSKLLGIMGPERDGSRLVMELNEANQGVPTLIAALSPAVKQARGAAKRMQAMNNLKQFAIAMHNFADVYGGAFPAVASGDKAGKPLLSWRVHLLPFLEQDALYKQFKLDEPWDSEHNKKLIEKMPAIFHAPTSKLDKAKGLTVYVAPVGEGLIFTGKPGASGTKFVEITDGTSNTVMLVEVADEAAVVWTSPEDWALDADKPLRDVLGQHGKEFLAALADGSVRAFNDKLTAETWVKLLTRAGSEVVDFP